MKDNFHCDNGVMKYAGVHLLIDIWGCDFLCDEERIRSTLLKAVDDCGATLVNFELKVFQPNRGVSGVAVLLESHISIHTWPELDFAALDVFTCGATDPYKTIPAIKAGFKPEKMNLVEVKRGIFD